MVLKNGEGLLIIESTLVHTVPPNPSVVSTLFAGILVLVGPRAYIVFIVRTSKFNVF